MRSVVRWILLLLLVARLAIADGFIFGKVMRRLMRSRDLDRPSNGKVNSINGSKSEDMGALGLGTKRIPLNITTARHIKDQVFYQYYWAKSFNRNSNSNSNNNSNNNNNNNNGNGNSDKFSSNKNVKRISSIEFGSSYNSIRNSNYYFEHACHVDSEHNATDLYFRKHVNVCPRPEYAIKILDPDQVMLKSRYLDSNDTIVENGTDSPRNATDIDRRGSKSKTEADKERDKYDVIHPYLAIMLLLPTHPVSQQFYDSALSVAHMFPNVVFAVGRSDQFNDLIESYYINTLPCILFFESGYYVEQNHDAMSPWSLATAISRWIQYPPQGLPVIKSRRIFSSWDILEFKMMEKKSEKEFNTSRSGSNSGKGGEVSKRAALFNEGDLPSSDDINLTETNSTRGVYNNDNNNNNNNNYYYDNNNNNNNNNNNSSSSNSNGSSSICSNNTYYKHNDSSSNSNSNSNAINNNNDIKDPQNPSSMISSYSILVLFHEFKSKFRTTMLSLDGAITDYMLKLGLNQLINAPPTEPLLGTFTSWIKYDKLILLIAGLYSFFRFSYWLNYVLLS